MLRVPCTSGLPSQRMRGITAATPAARWVGTSKSSPWSSPVPASHRPAASREGLGLRAAAGGIYYPSLQSLGCWLGPCSTRGMGLSVMEGVGGQLPGLWGPLRVNGTTTSTAGGHQSCPSPHGTEPPAILAVTPSLKALVGEDVTLECWVLGVPPPYVTWYKGETGMDLGSKPSPCTGGSPPPCRDIARGVPWTDGGRDPQRHSGC